MVCVVLANKPKYTCMIKKSRRFVVSLVACLALLLIPPVPVLGATYSSSNYGIDQAFFGTGGELDANSANYRAKETLGELGIGNSSSANYQVYAGFNTTDDPFLEFVVTGSNVDLGYLSTSQVTTATGTFAIRAWQTSGYVVRTESDPPTNAQGGHQITPLSSPTASSPGSEQFGINLVKNTNFCGVGCNLGNDPQQLPDSTFSFGQAATGYNTANQFKYAKSDIIALSNSATSVTSYTISYIFNISTPTPSGQYSFSHVLVATATY